MQFSSQYFPLRLPEQIFLPSPEGTVQVTSARTMGAAASFVSRTITSIALALRKELAKRVLRQFSGNSACVFRRSNMISSAVCSTTKERSPKSQSMSEQGRSNDAKEFIHRAATFRVSTGKKKSRLFV